MPPGYLELGLNRAVKNLPTNLLHTKETGLNLSGNRKSSWVSEQSCCIHQQRKEMEGIIKDPSNVSPRRRNHQRQNHQACPRALLQDSY